MLKNAASRLFCLILLFTAIRSAAQTRIFPQPLSPRIANYHIQVVLDDTNKTLQGRLTLTWRNPSGDTIPDLRFHLYYNAFRNAKSTFIRENMGKAPWARDQGWGWMDIRRLAVRGEELTDSLQYIAPDDGNPDDSTVVQIKLRHPVQPRETIRIDMEFSGKIPRNHVRTGWWQGDFFLMAQWFPKIGVYEPPGVRFIPPDAPRGRWNCHQFHAKTEFYADFGVYDVEITLPARYVVATTGIIERETDNGDGTKTVYAHAEDVHDFAWFADASVVDIYDTWENPKTGQRVSIRLLLQPGNGISKNAYLSAAKATLQYFDEWLGPYAYPYPLLTIVDVPIFSFSNINGALGMEYPTLITGAAFFPFRLLTFGRLRDVEAVTIHEISHQFWYGMVANNEFEEAFLDEGFATYSENRITGELFTPEASLIEAGGFKVSQGLFRRAEYISSDVQHDSRLTDPTYKAFSGVNLAYNKWSLALQTLEHYLGRKTFDAILRTYFHEWKFKHPGRDAFIEVANRVSGQDLSWFFEPILFGDGVVDFGLAHVSSVPLSRFERGAMFVDDTPDSLKPDEPQEQPERMTYFHKIVVRRIGEVRIPVEVLIRFDDGETRKETLDGQARIFTLTFEHPARLQRVVIDPEHKIPLDVNWLNNSWTRPHKPLKWKLLWKWFFWMQNLLTVFATIS